MISQQDKDRLIADVVVAVTEAVRDEIQKNACPLNEEERSASKMLYGLYTDLGDGDIKKGVRKMRVLFDFMGGIYSKRSIVTGAVFAAMVFAVIGFVGNAFIEGIVMVFKSAVK